MKLRGFKKSKLFAILLALFTTTLMSCEDFFEYEGDCEPKHKIRFVYDMNLKWADAFASEVHSVNLYVFDENRKYVKVYKDHGEALAQPNYEIDLDLPTNKAYTFVAWCGLYNEGAKEESFSVTEPVVGETTLDEFICTMNTLKTPPTKAEGDEAPMEYSDSQLYFLYHGMLQNEMLEDNHDGRTYIHTVYLTKDTNHIRIILQELSDDGIKDPKDFNISITNSDGVMAWDNKLLGNTVIDFSPWAQFTDMLGVGSIDTDDKGEPVVTNKPGLIADLSVGRMMEYQKDTMQLLITNKEGGLVAKVPIIQYFVLQKEYYETAYHHTMDDQEYLDRQDEYVVTFFLQGGKWIAAEIKIEDWRVVIHNYDLGDNNLYSENHPLE